MSQLKQVVMTSKIYCDTESSCAFGTTETGHTDREIFFRTFLFTDQAKLCYYYSRYDCCCVHWAYPFVLRFFYTFKIAKLAFFDSKRSSENFLDPPLASPRGVRSRIDNRCFMFETLICRITRQIVLKDFF